MVSGPLTRAVADRVSAAAEQCSDPWDKLVAGCEAFLASNADPEIRQIMLIDAPAVLGWDEWRSMDEASSGKLLVEVLGELIDQGTVAPQPVEPIARLLSGAMNEAAVWLAEADSPNALADTLAALRRLLESLRASR